VNNKRPFPLDGDTWWRRRAVGRKALKKNVISWKEACDSAIIADDYVCVAAKQLDALTRELAMSYQVPLGVVTLHPTNPIESIPERITVGDVRPQRGCDDPDPNPPKQPKGPRIESTFAEGSPSLKEESEMSIPNISVAKQMN
jgi:hypothetical protein